MKPLLAAGLAVLCAQAVATAATVPELIAKARATLGKEAGLNAVKSLRYTYKIADKDGKDLGPCVSEYLEPMCQRDLDYSRKDKEGRPLEIVTAINGAEGYRRVGIVGATAGNLAIMSAAKVDIRRDYAIDNLTFLAPPPASRGTVSAGPDETIEGVACDVLVYKYRSGLTLRYYLAKSDGHNVASRAEHASTREGLQIRVGEQRVAGIAFPKTIRLLDPDGKLFRTLTLEKVEVNPAEITAKTFATPLY